MNGYKGVDYKHEVRGFDIVPWVQVVLDHTGYSGGNKRYHFVRSCHMCGPCSLGNCVLFWLQIVLLRLIGPCVPMQRAQGHEKNAGAQMS